VVHHLHTRGQLDVADVNAAAFGGFAQVNGDVLGQLGGQAFNFDLSHDVVDHALVFLDGRRVLSTDKVQRHFFVQAGLGVHALEVHVQDQLFEGVVLNVAQDDLFGLAGEFHVQQRGVERFFFQGMPQSVVVQFDVHGVRGATKNDARHTAGDAQTAARTRTLLVALKSDELHSLLQLRGLATKTPRV